jgi:Rieske Fe-S protein
MSGVQNTKRRSFLNLLLTGSGVALAGAVLFPVIKYLIPPKEAEESVSNIAVGKVSELPVNQGKIFKFGRKPGILVHTPEGEIKAFIAICTHLECTVQYRADMKLIWCACHNGKYDTNGVNIAGPPPKPLTALKVNIKGDEIYVSPSV